MNWNRIVPVVLGVILVVGLMTFLILDILEVPTP